jgi:hypothetical protein
MARHLFVRYNTTKVVQHDTCPCHWTILPLNTLASPCRYRASMDKGHRARKRLQEDRPRTHQNTLSCAVSCLAVDIVAVHVRGCLEPDAQLGHASIRSPRVPHLSTASGKQPRDVLDSGEAHAIKSWPQNNSRFCTEMKQSRCGQPRTNSSPNQMASNRSCMLVCVVGFGVAGLASSWLRRASEGSVACPSTGLVERSRAAACMAKTARHH